MLFFPAAILNIECDDDRAFMEGLYDKYNKYMFFKAYFTIYNISDAEDIVEDSVYALIPHIETLRNLSPKALKTYISRTTVRTAYAYSRRRTAYKLINADIEDIEDIQSEEPEVDDWLIRQCNIVELRNAMNLLRAPDKELLYMKYFDLMDTDSIAKALHVTPGTVRSKLARARNRLYNIIKEQRTNE